MRIVIHFDIYIKSGCFTCDALSYLHLKLEKIETIYLDGYKLYLNETLLKYCRNVKTLFIRFSSSVDHTWLFHIYPKLENFVLLSSSLKLSDMQKSFAQSNRHLQRFETDEEFLLKHWTTIIECKLKFDILNIHIEQKLNELHDVFNKLYEKGS